MEIDDRLASGLGLSQSTINSIFDIGRSQEKRLQVAKALSQIRRLFWQGLDTFLANDPSPRVREQTAMSLGATGDDEVLSLMDKLACDAIPLVRRGVALGLLKHGSKAALPILVKLLFDDDPSVLVAACRAYLRMQALHPEAVAILEAPQDAPDSPLKDFITNSFLYRARSVPSDLAAPRQWVTINRTELFEKCDVELDSLIQPFAMGELPGEPTFAPPPPPSGGLQDVSTNRFLDEPQLPSAQEEPRQRYVNSWFQGHPDPQSPLRYGQEYELGIQISPKLRIGSFTRGRPQFTEPEGANQDTLDVVIAVVTDDFEILEKPAKRMRLPKDKRKDSPIITFRVRPAKNNQDTFISVLFYLDNNLFHEALIGARVQVVDATEEIRPTAYFPTDNKIFPVHGRRDMNIQVIEEKDGYRFILFYDFDEDQFDVVWCKLSVTRDRLGDLLQGVRQNIEAAVGTLGTTSTGAQGKIFFDGEAADVPLREGRLPKLYTIDDIYFQQAAKALARAGSRLFYNLFYPSKGSKAERDQARRVGEKLLALSSEKNLKVQVLSDDFFIPWNFLYDGALTTEKVDPSAFWGFKHIIEEIPHRVQEVEARDVIPVDGDAFGIGMNINTTKINKALTTPQIEHARTWAAKLPVSIRSTEDDVLKALRGAATQHPLEYFFCHAGTTDASHEDLDQSYLGLTSDTTGLTLESIKLQTGAHQFAGTPLFILNACDSAQMDGRFYDGFVPKFLSMGACAVVGSDADVPSLFGAHFGLAVLEGVLKANPLGEVLLSARQVLLKRHQNPLGLIYRVFGNSDVRLSAPLL